MKLSRRNKRLLISVVVGLLIISIGSVTEKYNWNFPGKSQVLSMEQNLAAGTYRVVSFEDGDTIVIDMNGTQERVRFIGVDTPEVKDPRKPVQCFGKAASNFTKTLIGTQPVRLEADTENTNRDRYNRLLRYVYISDGTLVNAKIIEEGYGFAYTSFPFSKKEEFRALEQTARTHNKGLWSSCQTGVDENGYNTINPE